MAVTSVTVKFKFQVTKQYVDQDPHPSPACWPWDALSREMKRRPDFDSVLWVSSERDQVRTG